MVDEGSEPRGASGSDDLSERIAVRDQKIGQAVQIAECLYKQYIQVDENFEQMSGRMQAMHLENADLKESQIQLKSLVQKQMKELKLLESELDTV